MPPATQGPRVHTCSLFTFSGVKNKPPCLPFLEQNSELAGHKEKPKCGAHQLFLGKAEAEALWV